MIHPYLRSRNVLPRRRVPPAIAEPSRDDLGFFVRLRWSRRWSRLSPEERRQCLLAGAEHLERYAHEMREEASNLP